MDGYNKNCIICIFFMFYFLIFLARKEPMWEEDNFYAIHSVQAKTKPKTHSAYFSNNAAQNHHCACFKKGNFSQGTVSCIQHDLTAEVRSRGPNRSPDCCPCTKRTVSHDIQLSDAPCIRTSDFIERKTSKKIKNYKPTQEQTWRPGVF